MLRTACPERIPLLSATKTSLVERKTGVQVQMQAHTHMCCQATFLSGSAPPRVGTRAEKASRYACTCGDTSWGQGVPAQWSWSRAGTEGTIGAFFPSCVLIPSPEASAACPGLGDLPQPRPGQRDPAQAGAVAWPRQRGQRCRALLPQHGRSHRWHRPGCAWHPWMSARNVKMPLCILHRPSGHHLSSSKSFWGAVGRNPAVSPFLHPN